MNNEPEHLTVNEIARRDGERIQKELAALTQPPKPTNGVTGNVGPTCCCGDKQDKPYTPAHELGKLRWSIESQRRALEQFRFKFSTPHQNQDLMLAIMHMEDALFRIERVVDNAD